MPDPVDALGAAARRRAECLHASLLFIQTAGPEDVARLRGAIMRSRLWGAAGVVFYMTMATGIAGLVTYVRVHELIQENGALRVAGLTFVWITVAACAGAIVAVVVTTWRRRNDRFVIVYGVVEGPVPETKESESASVPDIGDLAARGGSAILGKNPGAFWIRTRHAYEVAAEHIVELDSVNGLQLIHLSRGQLAPEEGQETVLVLDRAGLSLVEELCWLLNRISKVSPARDATATAAEP